jgi:hypothetical protein
MLGIGKFLQSFTEDPKPEPENSRAQSELDFFDQLAKPISTPSP